MKWRNHIKKCAKCCAAYICGNRAARCNRCAYERKRDQARAAAKKSDASKREYAAMLRLTGTREHNGDCIE